MQDASPSSEPTQPQSRTPYQDVSAHTEALRNLVRRGRVYFREGDSQAPATGEFNAYGRDRVKKFQPRFDVLVQPADTEETAELTRYAQEHALALVPSGGRTGLAGGALACRGEIVVSLEKMNGLLGFDSFLPALHVQAGMLTADVQREARERGLYYPVDFASSGSSTIGGNIATNAGGIHVIKYGMTREWTLGLTLVTGTGAVVRMNGPLLKNNTGPDLRHLVIGSEGILGLITEAHIRLTAPPGESAVYLLALKEFAGAPRILRLAREAGVDLHVFEYFDRECLDVVREHLGLPEPFRAAHAHYLLMEFTRPESPTKTDRFLTALSTDPAFQDAIQAESSEAAATFRTYREAVSESLSMGRPVHKHDVSLPIPAMQEFMAAVNRLPAVHKGGVDALFFGHVGDGNLHVNLRKPAEMPDAEFQALTRELDNQIYGMLRDMDGSISAEHGIGVLKKDYLAHTRSALEITLLREIKRLFDPRGIMNPGKVL